MNRSYLDRGWSIERRAAVGKRYQRMMAAKTRATEIAFAIKALDRRRQQSRNANAQNQIARTWQA